MRLRASAAESPRLEVSRDSSADGSGDSENRTAWTSATRSRESGDWAASTVGAPSRLPEESLPVADVDDVAGIRPGASERVHAAMRQIATRVRAHADILRSLAVIRPA